MIITEFNYDIPEWLKPHMRTLCKCGSYIVDDGPVGYDGVMKLTQRWCTNPTCPYHMGKRIEELAKYFKVEMVGEVTALNMAKTYKMKNHLEALKFWFNKKPEVHLYEVGKLAFIYGLRGKCEEVLSGYTSFEQYFNCSNNIPDELWCNKEYLLECSKYFNIKQKALPSGVLNIMVTGSIRNFRSRGQFIETLNDTYSPHFRIHDNKKTVRNTFCLVKEDESTDFEKTGIALANGIPIMNSAEFIALLEQLKGELDYENEDAGVH